MTHPLPIILLLLILPAGDAFCQNYLMNGSPITDCDGTFYDAGGQAGNYGNNQNLATTICSDGTSGTHIRLDFSGLALASGDEICFYDGSNAGAPLLACSSDYPPGAPFIIQATAVNASGCLTVTFTSNASGTAAGWSAVISCVPSCQTVLADLVSTNPVALPADTGWIDVCPGERVFFTGAGLYPQNGFAYQQSDSTTTFEWNFGDGGISYGPNTSHRFDQPGGYYVQLFLTDNQGCGSTNFINQRVRVSPRPSFSLPSAIDNTICAGDTIHLSAGTDSTATGTTLLVLPVLTSFAVEGSRSDSLALPDGTGIPYETSIFFSEFSPGQVLTNAADLESICVNIEHSWMRDMEISISCPNGQSIILHNFGGQTGSQVLLGIPNDNDLINPVPGTGFDYCWTPNATNPPWLQYANTILPGGGGTLPAGDYSPYESFAGLVGCPLNGEWTITVTDLWPIDNGYIFSWSIKLNDALYPNIETFTPQFTSWTWSNHPSIFSFSPDAISASPQNGGTAGYIFTVNDNFGCSWDTLIGISVLPFTHPDCHECLENYVALTDTFVCIGEPVSLNAASLDQDTFELRFEAYPDYRFGNGNHPHVNPYAAPIAVNSLGYNTLTNPTAQITSVCIDIETDFDADLNIYLRAPDGKQLELSTGNGAAGDNYKITCFSPSATIPIAGNAAPFNGTYIPEGNWANLNNAQVDGDWKLMVSDGFGINQYGKVKWWSIGFNFFNNATYTWTNAPTLSCNNCPNPVATPSATTTYTVTATDKFNCQHHDTVTVTMTTIFPAPANLDVISMSGNTMTWGWDAVPGASGYEVNVNNGGWQPANGGLSHSIGGLVSGNVVFIQVRAVGGNPNCPPDITAGSALFVVCDLSAVLDTTLPATCAGTATGSAFISVSNAAPPVQFFPNGMMPSFPNGNLTNIFPAGNNFVIVQDSLNCRDTVFFDITEPPPIDLTVSSTDALCNGDPDGTATASVTGGTGNITFSWQNCLGGPIINNATATGLYAGCYAVTATDANGCTATDSVTVGEPPPFVFNSSQVFVSCNGGQDGSATIEVSGGTPSYSLVWDDGDTTATATGLDAGFHFVTITDAAGCMAATFVQVLEPPMLVVDSTASKAVSCFGGNNGTATVYALGGTLPYTYLWNDAQAQITQKALNLQPGIYSVTVTDAKNCTTVTTVEVTAPPALVVSFVNVVHEQCAGDCNGEATVQAAGGTGTPTYKWDNPSIPLGAQTADDLCPGTYMVTVEDALGCTVTDKVTIDPAIPIDAHFDTIPPTCAGFQDGSIFATVTGGALPYQFQWSNGGTGPGIQNLPCGDYTLTLTDNAGCARIDTITLPCPTLLEIVSIVPQQVKCFGETNGQITVYATGGSGTLSYKWNDPNMQIDSAAVNLPVGSYAVTVTDGNGCTATATAQVTQPELLTVTTEKTDATCLGGTNGTATANPVGGTKPYQYAWNWVPGDQQQITALPAGDYTVTVIDNNGCTGTASAAVGQPTTPVQVTVTQTGTACFGVNNGSALATASGGNGNPFNYFWSNSQTGPSATNLPSGNVTVTATDGKGCTAVQSIVIQQFEDIQVNVAFVLPTCFGRADGQAAINLISGGAGMGDTAQYNYQWSVPNSPNSIYVGNLAGDKTYSVTVTDFQGCSGVFSFYVGQPPQMVAHTAIQNVSCFGLSDGSAEVIGITGANLPVSYTWSNGTNGPKIENLPAGSYILNIQDAKGCTESDTFAISQPDSLAVTFNVMPLLCSNDSNAVVTATIQGGTPEYALQWNTGTTTAQISNLGPGVYTLHILDKNGCVLMDSVFVIRPDSLVVQTESSEPQCFGGKDGRIRLLVSGGQPPFRFSLNGGPFGGSSTFIGLGAGAYTFQVKDGKDCITSLPISLGQPLAVGVSLGLDTTIVLGDSILLSPEVSNAFGMVEYEWRSYLLENFICADTPECSMIWAKPYQTNTYIVSITDKNGCRGEARVTVNVNKPRGVYVPTGFTPNGDLNNDLLVVYGKSRQVRNVLGFRVYDRWGELVYQDQNFNVNDETRGWDGLFRGKECDPGVYVWLVEVEYQDGYREALKGDVMLIR